MNGVRCGRIWLSTALAGLFSFFFVVCPRMGNAENKADAQIDWAMAREWWAFQSPTKAELPQINQAAWPSRRIDHFVLAKLEAKKLSPSPAATKHTLARRLYLDLTGLPPTPEKMRAFLGDETDGAYEMLVEELMQRTAYGERLASMWLNKARYAEDQAHQVGGNIAFFYPNAFKYRKWVIDAFNNDLPYDDFIRKQLAADLEKDKSVTDLPALGFIGLGHKFYNRNRLTVKAEEWSEQVDTLTRAFLGLTVACAQCHDHKYDPVTQKDYYALPVFSPAPTLSTEWRTAAKLKKIPKLTKNEPAPFI